MIQTKTEIKAAITGRQVINNNFKYYTSISSSLTSENFNDENNVRILLN